MCNCTKCNKTFKNKAGLVSHERYCDGIGTGLKRRKNIFICPKCHFIINTTRKKHVEICDGFGPRRRSSKIKLKQGQGQEKGKTFDEIYGKERSDLIKAKISKNLIGKSKGGGSTEETENIRRNKLRIAINKRYEAGWQSTAGRTKKIDYESPIAGKIKIDGSWELATCKFFDKNNYKWIRNTKRFDYIDGNNKKRTYCPDFYLIDLDVYIEVKGYTTELDKIKWSQFPNKIEVWDKIILKEKNIL